MRWKKVPATTNNITFGIIQYLLFHGHSASRINTQGQWDERLQMWRESGSRNGVFDIAATICGRAVWIDVKRGNDKLSPDQVQFMEEQQRAGAICLEVKKFPEFIVWYEENKTNFEQWKNAFNLT